MVATKKYTYGLGRRKSATASARLYKGKGEIKINDLAKDKGFSTTIAIEDSRVDAVALGKDVSFIIAGDTVINELTVAEGAKFTIGEIGIGAEICVQGSGVISEAGANAPLYWAYFKPLSGELKIVDNALVLR